MEQRMESGKAVQGRGAKVQGVGQNGFTYLGLLFAIALMGVTLALTGVVWHTAQQREKERELLFVGEQFRQAIASYYNRSPGAVKQYPKGLDELLKDPRQLTTQRYLRRIYADPVTGKAEWGLVKNRDERIIGVFSLSESEPLKQGNFREADKEFEGKLRYSEWQFVYTPTQATLQSVPATLPPVLLKQQPPVPPLQAIPPEQGGDKAEKADSEALCDTLLKNDAAVCQTMAARYGEEAGKICADSAEARFAECRLKQTTVGLPPLKIKFDPETPPAS
jgi:type II secretory pathway pseudopilin PulG